MAPCGCRQSSPDSQNGNARIASGRHLIVKAVLIDPPARCPVAVSRDHWRGFPAYTIPWIYFVPAFLQVAISTFSGAYKKNALSILRSLISLFYGVITLSALTYFFKQFAFSRAVVLITYLIALVVFVLWRIIVKVVFKSGIFTCGLKGLISDVTRCASKRVAMTKQALYRYLRNIS